MGIASHWPLIWAWSDFQASLAPSVPLGMAVSSLSLLAGGGGPVRGGRAVSYLLAASLAAPQTHAHWCGPGTHTVLSDEPFPAASGASMAVMGVPSGDREGGGGCCGQMSAGICMGR